MRPAAMTPCSRAGVLLAGLAGVGTALWSSNPWQLVEPAEPCFVSGLGQSLAPGVARRGTTDEMLSPVVMEGVRSGTVRSKSKSKKQRLIKWDDDDDEDKEVVTVPFKNHWTKYQSYEGFVYQPRKIPGFRLRLDRWGRIHQPFYRITAMDQRSKPKKTGAFLERVGWWDPLRNFDDPKFFKLKADRAIWWLRNGAQPSDMVASLLDISGIIRRTGPNAKYGEWEWRVPAESGPEAPQGWSYEGPHDVSWNNMPRLHHRKKQPGFIPADPEIVKMDAKRPLIERYGFRGYEKVPIEGTLLTDPVLDNFVSRTFPNTELNLK